jgi:glutamate/tyrosine decarboxylase-like PLP-dependent enzyme
MVKSAVFLGLGSDNVVRVETDEIGRLKPDVLEQLIKADIEKVNIWQKERKRKRI